MELGFDGHANLAGFEMFRVTDFPGVDEAEDAGVEVAVLHANKREGMTEATLDKNSNVTLSARLK